MPSVGLRLRCAIPVFARFDTRSKMAVPVVSDPVPAVVGTATRGKSFPGMGRPLPRGALTKSRKSASEVCQLAEPEIMPTRGHTRECGVQVHQLRSIDHTTASHCQKRIWLPRLREVDGLLDTAVLWLDPDFVVDFKRDTFPRQSLNDLLHCVQLSYVLVCDYHDTLRPHVLEVHAYFFCAPWAEANARRCHFESIFLLLREIDRCCEVSASLVDRGRCLVVVVRIGVTGARGRMRELDSPKEVHSSCGAGGRNADGGRDRHCGLLELNRLRGVCAGVVLCRSSVEAQLTIFDLYSRIVCGFRALQSVEVLFRRDVRSAREHNLAMMRRSGPGVYHPHLGWTDRSRYPNAVCRFVGKARKPIENTTLPSRPLW
jgi:hypothetical protein